MSIDWLQHVFFKITVVVILTLILDVCVSKLKTIFKFLIKTSFKNICLILLQMPVVLLMSKYNHYHTKTFAFCLSGCYNLLIRAEQNVMLKSPGSRAQLK